MQLVFVAILLPILILIVLIVGIGLAIVKPMTASQKTASVLLLVVGSVLGLWCGLRYDTSPAEGFISGALLAFCIGVLARVTKSAERVRSSRFGNQNR